MDTVDVAKNECRTEEYLRAVNPLAQIPVLKLSDGTQLKQSVAILEYLEEAFPEKPPLLPKDPVKRAQVREFVEIVNSYIQPMQNKATVEEIARLDPQLAEWLPKLVAAHAGEHVSSEENKDHPSMWPQTWIIKGFKVLESILTKQPADNQFSFGNEVTLADCALIPQVIGAKKCRVDMNPYPRICRVYKNVVALEPVAEQLSDVLSSVE